MAGCRYCLRWRTFSSWKHSCSIYVLFAARYRNMSSVCSELDGIQSGRQEQQELVEDLFSTPSDYWINRLGKTSSRCPDVSKKLHNQYGPGWVGDGSATLCAHVETDLRRYSVHVSGAGDELRSLCDGGQLDRAVDLLLRMEQRGVVPSVSTYRCLLKACVRRKALCQARQLQAHLCRRGLESTNFLGEYIVSTLVKCGGLEDALKVFDSLPQRTVVSWTALISGYAQSGQMHQALSMYQRLQDDGVQPSTYTFVSLLKACHSAADLQQGKLIHGEAVKHGCGYDLFVRTALVDMYGKCDSIVDAQNVFDELSRPDVVAWNALLAAYCQQGKAKKTLLLYEQMQEQGMRPDARTLVSTLQACGMLAEEAEGVAEGGESTRVKSLQKGKAIHAVAQRNGYGYDVYVGSALINMYGKCRGVEDAQNVFRQLSQYDLVSWNAMLAAFVENGQAERALQLYERLRDEDVSPNGRSFVSVLHACAMLAGTVVDGKNCNTVALVKGKIIHAETHRKHLVAEGFVANTLISVYGKCGSILDAWNTFITLSQRDVVSWTAMITVYVEQGLAKEAFQLYEEMQEEAVSPNIWTVLSMLQACGLVAEEEGVSVQGERLPTNAKATGMVKAVHAEVWRKGYDVDVVVGHTLISMYGKCGTIVDAKEVFDGLSEQGVVAWTVMLTACVEQGQAVKALQLYEQMQEKGLSPNNWTFRSALQACCVLAGTERDISMEWRPTKIECLGKGKAIHAHACRRGYSVDMFVCNTLVSMYAKCGSVIDAWTVFNASPQPDIVAWNVMLGAYVEQDHPEMALELYEQMQMEGVSPDAWTFVSVNQSVGMSAERDTSATMDGQFGKVKYLGKGKAMHAVAQRMGYESDVVVGNTLVCLYSRCGSIVDAQNLFDVLPQRDSVSWNSMLAAYVSQSQGGKALQLYEQMQEEAVSADAWTYVSLLQACGACAEKEEDVMVDGRSTKVRSLLKGKEVHAEAWTSGFATGLFFVNTLISMYGKCGSVVDAQNVFYGSYQRDMVSWNAMLSVYAQEGLEVEALQLYYEMLAEGVSLDARTFVSVLQACKLLAEKEEDVVVDGRSTKVKALEKGKSIHAYGCRKGFIASPFVGNSLISMYGKCGTILDAEIVFEALSDLDIVSWNAMLMAYAQQGEEEKAVQLYSQMKEESIHGDEITHVCMLQACSNVGSLAMVEEIHHTLISAGTDLCPLLASSLIRAYGRCSSMVKAQAVFDALSQPDEASWNALISGYSRDGNCTASMKCYEQMELAGIKPNGLTFLSLLSACSHAGFVDKGVEYFRTMSTSCGITPKIDHYVSMVDLFGRAGCFKRLNDLLLTMPLEPDLAIWLSLLGACQKHGEVLLGEQAFDSAVRLQPQHAAAYVMMSNIYANAGLFDSATTVNMLRQMNGASKKPGQSWIAYDDEVHNFAAGLGK